jgi:hypothetical protein
MTSKSRNGEVGLQGLGVWLKRKSKHCVHSMPQLNRLAAMLRMQQTCLLMHCYCQTLMRWLAAISLYFRHQHGSISHKSD